MQNRIAELRRAVKLTSAQLAAKARVGPRRLLRIEAGVEAPRVGHAFQICAALGATLDQTFPSTRLVLERFGRVGRPCGDLIGEEKFRDQLEAAGMDAAPVQWSFRYRLKGGIEGAVEVSCADKRRLWQSAQGSIQGAAEFVIFDGGDKRIALNLTQLQLCQFLFDRPSAVDSEQDEDRAGQLELYFVGDREPLRFEVEPDEATGDDQADDGTAAPLQTLLESMAEGDRQMLSFEDFDGERVFFDTEAIALFTVPLVCVEPTLLRAEDDEVEEH